MISSVFHAVLLDPFYNALVLILSYVPYADIGIAIILLPVAVRLLFWPVFSKTIKTQIVMKRLEPELEQIKETYKKDPTEQAKRVMALYKDNKVSPFASLFVALIQIPIFLALYFVFLRGFPDINVELLYPFVQAPSEIPVHFFGLFDLTKSHNIILAALAGVSQYAQIALSPLGAALPKAKNPSFKDDFARSYRVQLKYGLPALIAVFGWGLPGAISLYWITNNVVGIFQELFIRRRIERQFAPPTSLGKGDAV